MAEYGAGEILLTSMDRDGTCEGFDLALTRAVSDAVPVPVIASGGISSLADLEALRALVPDGVEGAILRAQLTEEEVHILRGIARQMLRVSGGQR